MDVYIYIYTPDINDILQKMISFCWKRHLFFSGDFSSFGAEAKQQAIELRVEQVRNLLEQRRKVQMNARSQPELKQYSWHEIGQHYEKMNLQWKNLQRNKRQRYEIFVSMKI